MREAGGGQFIGTATTIEPYIIGKPQQGTVDLDSLAVIIELIEYILRFQPTTYHDRSTGELEPCIPETEKRIPISGIWSHHSTRLTRLTFDVCVLKMGRGRTYSPTVRSLTIPV